MYTEGKMTMKPIISRFFRYISIDTQGDDQASCCPSNENQRLLADLLCEELKEFGVTDVRVDENVSYTQKFHPIWTLPCLLWLFWHTLTRIPGSSANISTRGLSESMMA